MACMESYDLVENINRYTIKRTGEKLNIKVNPVSEKRSLAMFTEERKSVSSSTLGSSVSSY